MKASINAAPQARIVRSAARIERLRKAIKKARGQDERVIALLAELERREDELQMMKASIDAALK